MRRSPPLHEQDILRFVTKVLFVFIVVFSLYVITGGELGPGGGFQGGVIAAAAYILYALVYGLKSARRMLPRKVTDVLIAVGVMIYAGTGVSSLFLGGTFLEYNRLGATGPEGQELGLTLVEWGVALTVFSVMVTLFSEIVERE